MAAPIPLSMPPLVALTAVVAWFLLHSYSLVEHLLGCLLELTAAVHVADILGGCSTGTVGCGILSWSIVLLINDHALGACSVFLRSGTISLITFTTPLGSGRHTGLLANNVQHTVFQSLLIFRKAILLPGVIEDSWVVLMARQATLEEVKAGPVVGLLFELEASAVLHELTELTWVASTQLLQRSLNLLFLDVVVLFVLGATRETLPR